MNNKFWLFALGMALGVSKPLLGSDSGDLASLRQLNADNLRAFLTCDVASYRQLLADDFHCVLADGRLIDKAGFLELAAQPPGVADFRRQEPLISLYGDAALIIARISYRRQDGTSVQTRYIDVCVRRDGSWQIVSAQFTRVAATGR